MRLWPRLALLCLLLLAAAAPPAAGAPAAGPALQETDLPPESTTITIQMRANGDAELTLSTRFRLDDENDSAAFDQLAAEFRSGDADIAYDVATFERAAAAAANATGREMRIRDVQYNTTRMTEENVTYGRLAVHFRWTNFAEQAGDRIRLGDAFNTTTGTWLPGLASGQTLIIRPPPGYAVLNSPPDVGVQNGAFRWDGPRDFEPGYLGAITYTGATPTPTPTTTAPTDEGGLPIGLLGGGAVLLAIAVVAAVLLVRQGEFDVDGAGSGSTSADGGADDGGGDEPPAADADGAASAGASPDPELLSDEERVERLLERNGGRMKQATIVEETGWSNAKVSQLLSGMADEGRVDKLRIGRENLISLPDEDVTDLDDE
ncbi:helix-turn-helix transcriptional regulator [Halosegnis sp.]|uniref:helix-turn-helix transcriptional regulator n=1 Tax=Halosegnis sp. TaxID=2864959 RepID=UPI0035D3FE3C